MRLLVITKSGFAKKVEFRFKAHHVGVWCMRIVTWLFKAECSPRFDCEDAKVERKRGCQNKVLVGKSKKFKQELKFDVAYLMFCCC